MTMLAPAPKVEKPEFTTAAIGLRASQPHHAPLAPEKPYVYVDRTSICIENQGSIPLERCIFTNEMAEEIRLVALRDPKNPGTWFGKRPKLRVGLSKSAVHKLRIGKLLTWSSVTVGVVMIGFGIAGTLMGVSGMISLPCYGAGAILGMIAGFFRANASIAAPVVGRSFTVINRAHADFLTQFDQYEDGELKSAAQ